MDSFIEVGDEILERARRCDPATENVLSEWCEVRDLDVEDVYAFVERQTMRFAEQLDRMPASEALRTQILFALQTSDETAAKRFAGRGMPPSD